MIALTLYWELVAYIIKSHSWSVCQWLSVKVPQFSVLIVLDTWASSFTCLSVLTLMSPQLLSLLLPKPPGVQSVSSYESAELLVLPLLKTHQWYSVLLVKEQNSFLGTWGRAPSGPAPQGNLNLPLPIPFAVITVVFSLFLFPKLYSLDHCVNGCF